MADLKRIEKSEIKLILEFLQQRFNYPKKSVAFVIYFFTIIVLIGITSSFIGLFETIDSPKRFDTRQISLSIIGYSIVLLCSSAIDFIFIQFKDDEMKYSELKNAITMIGVASIIVGIFLALLAYYINKPYFQLSISFIMILLVWCMWWISNARTLSVLNNSLPPRKEAITGGTVIDVSLSGEIPKDIIA